MKTSIVILLILSSIMSIFAENISFHSKLYDGDWARYIGVRNNGPLFIGSDQFCYIDDKNNLVTSDLLGNEIKSIALNNAYPEIFRTNSEIMLKDGENISIFNGKSLISMNEYIRLSRDFFYDFNSGIFRVNSEYKKIDLIEDNVDSFSNIMGLPRVDEEELNIYFIIKEDKKYGTSMYGTLIKIDTRTNKVKRIKEKVGDFSFLNKDRILLYSYDSKLSHMRMSAFHGDFSILNIHSKVELYNTDKLSYKNNYEYVINRF